MALFGLNPAMTTPEERQATMAACDIHELFHTLRQLWDHTAELSAIGLERVDLASALLEFARDGEVHFCAETFRHCGPCTCGFAPRTEPGSPRPSGRR
jgi:class 3 adenylate cyclase